MRCTIKINMDNDAFEPYNGGELYRILHYLAEYVSPGVGVGDCRAVYDSNGNLVGKLRIEK